MPTGVVYPVFDAVACHGGLV